MSVDVEEIAYFYSDGRLNFFKTLDNNIQAKINNKGYSSDIGEFINLRAETQKNISDIERTTLKVEMQFLRS